VANKESKTPKSAVESGSGRYVFSYVGNSIRKHKTRSLSLLLGVVIGVALVASVFVWTDTGTRVAIDDYFSENSFQFSVQQRYEYPVDITRIFDVQSWVTQQGITEESFVVYHSIGLLGIANMSDSDPYLPHPYSMGIKDCQTFFVQQDFLSLVRDKFNYTGTFIVEPGQCLVSRRVISDVEDILNISLGVGSSIDIAIAQIYDNPLIIGDLDRLNITNVQIAGIFDLPPAESVLYTSFQGVGRANYPASGEETVFGWNDGIIFHTDQLANIEREVLIGNSLFPKLFIRLSPVEVMNFGLENVVEIIRRFKAQLEVAFQGRITVSGERQLLFLEQYIVAYQSRRTMGVLVAPVIVLSIFLTTFSTNIFLSGRRAEVAILRARGASFRQLYAAFILEFVVIGIIGLVIGLVSSLFIGSLIPASVGFLQFDMNEFNRFFAVVRLQPLTWIIATVACIVPPLVFTMIYVRSFLRTEIYQAMVGINPPGESEVSIIILYFVGCLALLGFFFVAVLILPSTPSVAILQFIYAVAIWTLLSDSGSRVVRRFIAGLTRVFRPVFGEKTHIFVKSMRTRRERIVPLLLILTLTFSVTVFSVVEAQTVQDNAQRQIEYFIGADFRVESGWVPTSRVSEITAIQGIEDATALVRTYAVIGTQSLVLIGIDVTAYSSIGEWDLTSMVGEEFSVVLNRLQNDPDGIIFPYTLANRLSRSIGDSIGILVYNQGGGGLVEDHIFNIVGLGQSAPGLGYFDPEDPARPLDSTGGFGFQESSVFGLVHQDYLASLNITNSQLFLATGDGTNDVNLIQYSLQQLGFSNRVYTPATFSLEEAYPDGYLFNRGVVSILSMGFLACLFISIIALTLFVGIIVSERQTEYAIMRAVGGTRRQIIAVVVGEFFGLILTSFIVSLLLGTAFSWILMNVLLNLFPFPFVVPFPITLPGALLFMVLAVVMVGMGLGTYIPARRAGRTNVGRVLRNL
jgi:ABC-type antimicrobial peptide transport system permease subunit